jgi:hypothetical protein
MGFCFCSLNHRLLIWVHSFIQFYCWFYIDISSFLSFNNLTKFFWWFIALYIKIKSLIAINNIFICKWLICRHLIMLMGIRMLNLLWSNTCRIRLKWTLNSCINITNTWIGILFRFLLRVNINKIILNFIDILMA